jgi:hypothetical protein
MVWRILVRHLGIVLLAADVHRPLAGNVTPASIFWATKRHINYYSNSPTIIAGRTFPM